MWEGEATVLQSTGSVSPQHCPGLQPWVWFKIVPAFPDVPRMPPVQSEDGEQAACVSLVSPGPQVGLAKAAGQGAAGCPEKLSTQRACRIYLLLQREKHLTS